MHIVKKKISSLFPSTQEVFTSAVPAGASGDLQASKVTLGILLVVSFNSPLAH